MYWYTVLDESPCLIIWGPLFKGGACCCLLWARTSASHNALTRKAPVNRLKLDKRQGASDHSYLSDMDFLMQLTSTNCTKNLFF